MERISLVVNMPIFIAKIKMINDSTSKLSIEDAIKPGAGIFLSLQ